MEIIKTIDFKDITKDDLQDRVNIPLINEKLINKINRNLNSPTLLMKLILQRHSTPLPPPPPFFATTWFFCNHFEELKTVLFEVELIINNAPLTYVYPKTIETYLTPNNLLSGRQLLYSFNTTSTVDRNLTVLSSNIDKINPISNNLLDRWRHEYILCNKFTWDITNIKIIKYKLPKNLY